MKNKFSFLPMNKNEMQQKGWQELDIIIVSAEPYLDHHGNNAAMLGRYLESEGFKVGIIAEPDINKNDDFLRLGAAKLCFIINSLFFQ